MKIGEEQIPDLIRKGDDQEVIRLLYKKVFPIVENYIRKRGGKKEDAGDAFQDALLLFYKQVVKGSYNPKYKAFGYLFRLSLNCWINRMKKEQRIKYMEELSDERAELDEEEIPINTGGYEENLLKKLFGGIGEKCVELLTYSIYYDLLIEDIMHRMEFTSVGAVKMQQQRCKQKLMKEIEANPALADKLKEYERSGAN